MKQMMRSRMALLCMKRKQDPQDKVNTMYNTDFQGWSTIYSNIGVDL